MNEHIELFNWNVSLTYNEADKLVSARVESKHKFGKSVAANEVVSAIESTINTLLTPESLDLMASQAAEGLNGASQQ